MVRIFGLRLRAAGSLAALAAAVLALSTLPPHAHAAETNAPNWTLDQLMSTLAQYKSRRATFVELKYLSITAQPVKSSGELVFIAPDHLEKVTTSPKPERLVVDGDMLTVERGERKYTLALARYPELSAFIDSIRATLSGNREVLEHVYQVALAGSGDGWTLTLTPLDSRTRKVVRTITLDGARGALHTVAIEQADGDHSVMQLQEAARE
ncbi:outer membrane lipoprotein carrier protein LolA [Trinickia terrae]|uniref:Outer membrane lipoprotein carrier protein LolA n=1 Tax=Trinickia terrae TaxID=2571161 RepID=A0A4V5PIC8_9BURK|nr:LolA-related protein [Trinickia terrae]TKC86910.1 outer membrane lipoprotein carrier protein LolA [Trinickia terrae]